MGEVIYCRLCDDLVLKTQQLATVVTNYKDYRITIYMHITCRDKAGQQEVDNMVSDTEYDCLLSDDELDLYEC